MVILNSQHYNLSLIKISHNDETRIALIIKIESHRQHAHNIHIYNMTANWTRRSVIRVVVIGPFETIRALGAVCIFFSLCCTQV